MPETLCASLWPCSGRDRCDLLTFLSETHSLGWTVITFFLWLILPRLLAPSTEPVVLRSSDELSQLRAELAVHAQALSQLRAQVASLERDVARLRVTHLVPRAELENVRSKNTIWLSHVGLA